MLPAALEELAARIVDAMRQEAERHCAAGCAPHIDPAAIQYTRVTDPSNQLPGYEGVWRNARGERCGILTFNSDGSFIAEYDIFMPHPQDARWFVETVSAWGNAESVRCEVQRIPAM